MSTRVLLLLTFVSPAAFTQDVLAQETPRVLRLDEVLASVRANSPVLAGARDQAEIAAGEVQRAWTAWQPQVNAIGQVQLNSAEQVFDVAPLVQGIITPINARLQEAMLDPIVLDPATLPPRTEIQPHVQLAALLTLRQTLFNITALRAPGVAKKGLAAAETGVRATEDELVFNAAQIYATLAGLAALDQAASRAIDTAERRIQDAKVQVEAGTAVKLALTRAETDKASAVGQQLSLRAQRQSLLAALRALMGSEEAIEVSTAPIDQSIDLVAEGSIEDRNRVIAKKKALEAAEAAIGLSSSNWMPTLAADGALRYSNVEGFSGEKFLATATINLVIPLYDSGVRYADTRIAEARAMRARHELEAERLQARAFLEEANAKLESARAEVTQAEAALKLATEAVAQVESLAANGLATNLDLNDADAKRFSADQLVAQKKLDVDLALIRVAYARGARLEAKSVGRERGP